MKKYIYIYLYSFVGYRLSEKVTEERGKNFIEIIRDGRMGREN